MRPCLHDNLVFMSLKLRPFTHYINIANNNDTDNSSGDDNMVLIVMNHAKTPVLLILLPTPQSMMIFHTQT